MLRSKTSLPWNGTDLGVLDPNDIIKRIADGEYNYIRFYWGDEIITARITKTTSHAPMIIDEMKPIFGLPKIGTHRVKCGGYEYSLFRVRLSPRGNICQELTLDQLTLIGHVDSFRIQVQELFCFRELIGITKSVEKSIQIRVIGNKYYPLSYYEPSIVPACYGRVIPYTVLDSWFSDSNLNLATKKLLGVQNPESIPYRIHRLRGDLEKVIERVDRDWIWCVDSICQRALNRIC